jgi:hypothetical protein
LSHEYAKSGDKFPRFRPEVSSIPELSFQGTGARFPGIR